MPTYVHTPRAAIFHERRIVSVTFVVCLPKNKQTVNEISTHTLPIVSAESSLKILTKSRIVGSGLFKGAITFNC